MRKLHLSAKFLRSFPPFLSFVFLFISFYLLSMDNIHFFLSSSDFRTLVYSIEDRGVNVTKFIIYPLRFFSNWIAPQNLLLLIWSFIPAISTYFFIAALYKKIICPARFRSIVLMFCILGGWVPAAFLTEEFFLLPSRAGESVVPTGHLLMQSAAASFVLLSIKFRDASRILFYVPAFIALSLHFSALVYLVLISVKMRAILIKFTQFFFRCKRKSHLAAKFVFFAFLAFSPIVLVVSYNLLVAFRAGELQDSLLANNIQIDGFWFVIKVTMLAVVGSLAYKIHSQEKSTFDKIFMSGSSRLNGYSGRSGLGVLSELGLYLSILSLAALPFFPGLAYRIAYPLYIYAPGFLLMAMISGILMVQKPAARTRISTL